MNERRHAWSGWLAVWVGFLLVSFLSAPAPGVNESHYLTKARHFWNPDWCARDFFLTSYPAHFVFYVTLGWLTKWMSLPVVAVIGRVVSLGLLAAGWCSLTKRILARDSVVVLSAGLFLGMQSVGNLSGEWLIGGVESKVFAYACVLGSVSAILDRRLLVSALLSGVAISFHPIVGLWHVAAVTMVEVANCKWRIADCKLSGWSRKRVVIAIGLLILAALPGFVPAVRMLIAVDAKTAFAANYVQVFYRLRHHLDPMDFAVGSWIAYGLLSGALLWLWLQFRQQISAAEHWWLSYFFVAWLFALAGLLIGLGPRPGELMAGFRWRMAALKFYPFRLFDLLLPLTLSLCLPRFCATSRQRVTWLWMLGAIGLSWSAVKSFVVEPPIAWSQSDRANWNAACQWIEANTPPEALFVTPKESDSFKWTAQRAEFVNFKDCPQDAVGVVEWNRRLRLMTRWSEAGFADGQYSTDELRELRRQTGAEFVMARVDVPYDPAWKIYSNGTFQVFRLPH